jgi:hypothetical protein
MKLEHAYMLTTSECDQQMAELAQYSQACILNKVNQVAFYK